MPLRFAPDGRRQGARFLRLAGLSPFCWNVCWSPRQAHPRRGRRNAEGTDSGLSLRAAFFAEILFFRGSLPTLRCFMVYEHGRSTF